MNTVLLPWASWVVSELGTSALLFIAYVGLRRLAPSAANRYWFLKFAIPAAFLIPFLPTTTWFTSGGGALPLRSVAPFTASHWAPQVTRAVRGAAQQDRILALMFALYVTIFLFCLGRMLFSLIRLSFVATEGKVVSRERGYELVIHDLALPPATIGFFRPRILVPRSVQESVDADQFAMILRHEQTHIARRDYAFNLLVGFVRSALFFSPFSQILARHFQAEMELSCDDILLRSGEFRARDYGALLLELGTRVAPRVSLSNSGLFVANSLITRRIEAMKTINQKNRTGVTIGVFLLLVSCCLYGGVAFGLPFMNGTANLDSTKDLQLEFKIDIDTDKGPGAVATDGALAVNYEETASVMLGGKRVDIKPTKSPAGPQMVFDVYDDKGELAHHSVVPFQGWALLSAKLDPQTTGIHKVDIKVKQR